MLEHIEASNGTQGGQPRIAGTRVTVADVVLMHRRMGRSLEDIAATYDLSLASVYAAMSYYYDHKIEIESSLDHEEIFGDASSVTESVNETTRKEMEWVSRNRKEFAGKWVAVKGDRLIAHGSSAKEVFDTVDRLGIDDPLVVQIDPLDSLPFGGW